MKGITNGMKAELHLCQECSIGMTSMLNLGNLNLGNLNLENIEMPINLEDLLGNMDSPISLENIFKGILESVQSIGNASPNIGQSPNRPQAARRASGPCATCGLSYEQFKATGKLGCEACYQAFPKEIVALFKNVQSSSHHEGKLPKRFGSGLRQQREVDKLRASLRAAIDNENYEEAAKIRDQIRSMEVTP